jgi:elongation factor Tu
MKPGYSKDVEAEIYFLTAAEGGRGTPFTSGYRPQFYYDGHDWDAIQNYPDEGEPVHPGDTVTTYLSFLSPHCHVGKLFPGKEFLVREGTRTVGRAMSHNNSLDRSGGSVFRIKPGAAKVA